MDMSGAVTNIRRWSCTQAGFSRWVMESRDTPPLEKLWQQRPLRPHPHQNRPRLSASGLAGGARERVSTAHGISTRRNPMAKVVSDEVAKFRLVATPGTGCG
jgi:hypothetical protein